MKTRLTTAFLALTCLACAGIGAKLDLQRAIVKAELQGTGPALRLGRGMEAVALRCGPGGDLESDRCEAIAADAEEVVGDDVVTEAEVEQLLAAYPELGEEPEPGPDYDRLRRDIDASRDRVRNDYSKWPRSELPERMRAAGWDPSCDVEPLEVGGERQLCQATIGDNMVEFRLFDFGNSRVRRAYTDDIYIAGASRTSSAHILNARMYEETTTKLIAKKIGMRDNGLDPERSERWIRRRLRRVVETVYSCEDRGRNGLVCWGGDDDYGDTMELRVRDDDPTDPETRWYGQVLTRHYADGTELVLEVVEKEVSQLRLTELLATLRPEIEAIDLPGLVERCVHWRGEEPTDPERTRQIMEGVEASCDVVAAHLAVHPEAALDEPVDAAAVVDFANVDDRDLHIDYRYACSQALLHHRAEKKAGRLDLSLSGFPTLCPELAEQL